MPIYEARLLERDEVPSAQKLIYESYVKGMGWVPPPNNPSNYRVEPYDDGHLLTDDYDASAKWFGCFCDGSLVAVHRWSFPIDGRFETERYSPIPPFLKDGVTAEQNRLAQAVNGAQFSPAFFLLIAAENRYAKELGLDFGFSTSTFPIPGDLFCRVGMKKIEWPTFKYDASDPAPVQFLYFDVKNTDFAKIERLAAKLLAR